MTSRTLESTRPRRVVGYVRVSSREQAEDHNALEQQRARVREAGATEIFEDVLSGRRDDRPAYRRLMELVKQGEVDEIIFTRIDRLTRSIVELSRCIDLFETSGVNLRILDQNLDLKEPTGKLMARLLGAVAEWESDLLSQRVRHGKDYQRKLKMACESAPRGYVVVDNRYQLNLTPVLCLLSDRPDDYLTFTATMPLEQVGTGRTVADLARDLVELFFEAKTPRATLQQFYHRYGVVRRSRRVVERSGSAGPQPQEESETRLILPRHAPAKDWAQEMLYWTESGLRNWLTNPVLEGNTAYQKWIQAGRSRRRSSDPPVIHPDTHPEQALISHEEATYIRETIAIHRNMGGGSFIPAADAETPQYRPYAYLNALVYCYACGSKCCTKTSCQGQYTYFVCPHAAMGCDNSKAAPKPKVEQGLIKKLVRRSQQMRVSIREIKRPFMEMHLLRLNFSNASAAQVAEFYRQNQPQYSDLLEIQEPAPVKSERLQGLEAQLQHLEALPGFYPQVEELKAQLRTDIEREQLQSAAWLNKSAGEIVFAGNESIFWDALSLEQKVEIYPRIIDRLYIQSGQVKQVDFKVEIPDGEAIT